MGIDTMDAQFEKLCYYHAKNGTTSWLATTMTMGYDEIEKVCNAKTDYKGAQILGFHLEGPYISKKYKGAQNEKYIKNPSIEDFNRFNKSGIFFTSFPFIFRIGEFNYQSFPILLPYDTFH